MGRRTKGSKPVKDEGVNYSLNAPLTAHEGGSSSGGVSGKVEAVHGIHLTVMWIVSFTVFLCACFACYDWFHIYLKTEGATCSGGGACVSDPKCDLNIRVYMNAGVCFPSEMVKCWSWRRNEDSFKKIGDVTDTDVHHEAMEVFWPAFHTNIGCCVAFSLLGWLFVTGVSLFTILRGIMQCLCCCCLWCNRRNNPELAEQQEQDRQQQQEMGQGNAPQALKDHPYRIGFGGFLLIQAICALNFGLALLRVGAQQDSLDMFDPATWMDYIDAGHGIFNDDHGHSECDDPSIYTYTWGDARTSNGMALSAAVIGFSCACGGILYIVVVSGIRYAGSSRNGGGGGGDDTVQYTKPMPQTDASAKAQGRL